MSENMKRAFEENAARADEAARQASEDLERANNAYITRQEAKRQKARNKATRSLVVKAALVLAICICLMLAMRFDLMSTLFGVPCMAAALAWLTFWLGAWVQFMWAKGGLLNVSD